MKKKVSKKSTKKLPKITVKDQKLPRITAKDRHRVNLLAYLADWDNTWPKSQKKLAAIVNISLETLRFHFVKTELDQIYSDALDLRKKNSYRQRTSVYDSMLKEAEDGNVTAQKEFLDRTEGKVTDKIQHTGKDGTPLQLVSAMPEPESIEKQSSETASTGIPSKGE